MEGRGISSRIPLPSILLPFLVQKAQLQRGPLGRARVVGDQRSPVVGIDAAVVVGGEEGGADAMGEIQGKARKFIRILPGFITFTWLNNLSRDGWPSLGLRGPG